MNLFQIQRNQDAEGDMGGGSLHAIPIHADDSSLWIKRSPNKQSL